MGGTRDAGAQSTRPWRPAAIRAELQDPVQAGDRGGRRALAAFALQVAVQSLVVSGLLAQTPEAIRFETFRLSADFIAEGADAGDLDGDGHVDVVAGRRVFFGPDFTRKLDLGPVRVADRAGYSDAFFVFVHDAEGDGDLDVLIVGFPGKEAELVLVEERRPFRFSRHRVAEGVDNESPWFGDLDGDGRPELLAQHEGAFGVFEPSRKDPRAPWTFRPLTESGFGGAFTHGLGAGDLDGDGHPEILHRGGWFRRPEPGGSGTWTHHPFPFAAPGGAQMHVADLDGDGRAEVLTARDAHGYGLSVFRGLPSGAFEEIRVTGERPEQNPHELVVGNLHAQELADLDGDGLGDWIVGTRVLAHGGRDRADQDPPALWWLKTVRGREGLEWIPHRVSDESGVGVQVVARDVDGDGLLDLVVANKNGVFAHLQRRGPGLSGSAEGRLPLAEELGERPRDSDGRFLNLDFETGDLSDFEVAGDAGAFAPVPGDSVRLRRADMRSGHRGRFWIGTYEHARSDAARGRIRSRPFPVRQPFASMLVGGGARPDVGVEIRLEPEGRLVAVARGQDREDFEPVVFDLRGLEGRLIRLEIVDDAEGPWGHVNADDFRWHAQRPQGRPAEVLSDPAWAAARMEVLPGLEVDLIAAEPRLHQPIALALDARGRIWVAEAHSYPAKRGPGQGEDRILVFADEDQDGDFELRREFLGGLDLVSGLEVGHGGVWIGAAPELLFVPDRDEDLVPDGPPEVVLDGFGLEDTHETLNSFVWGPDGWLWGCHGVFTHSRVGRPGTPDPERVPMNAAVWRVHPGTLAFEVVAHGTSNPWGLDFDADGEAFIEACVIPHLWHIVPGGRYQRQAGRHFEPWVTQDIPTIADHVHWIGATPHAGNGRSDAAGGGHAHAGLAIAAGPGWPDSCRDAVLIGNIHGNRIVMDRLHPEGDSFRASHAGDFLLAHDPAFRVVALRQGPGGGLFLIDWHDRQACHRVETEIWDRTNGRLFRVRAGPKCGQPGERAPVGASGLAAELASTDRFRARTAFRRLCERRLEAPTGDAARRLLGDPEPRRRMDGLRLWAFAPGADPGPLLAALEDPDPRVAATAVRVLSDGHGSEPRTATRLLALAGQRSEPWVLRELASALRRLPAASARALALALAERTELETLAVTPLLVWFGVGGQAVADPDFALELLARARAPLLREQAITETARRRLRDPAAFWSFASGLPREGDIGASTWAILLRLLDEPAGRGLIEAREAVEVLRALEGSSVLASVASKLAARRKLPPEDGLWVLALDAREPAALRRRALEVLLSRQDWRSRLDPGVALRDPVLLRPLLEALGRDCGPEAWELLRGSLGHLEPASERAVLRCLVSRSEWARALLEEAAAPEVGAALEEPEIRAALERHPDTAVRELHARRLAARGEPGPAGREARIDAWLQRLRAHPGDPVRGRSVFARTCQGCHRLFEVGGAIGPDLTGSQRRDPRYVLANLLDPSAEVPEAYQVTVVELEGGRSFEGLLAREDEAGIELRTPDGLEWFDRAEIARDESGAVRIRRLATSMMPSDLVELLGVERLADLLAYLAVEEQCYALADARMRYHFAAADGSFARRVGPGLVLARDGGVELRAEGRGPGPGWESEIEIETAVLELRVELEACALEIALLDRGGLPVQQLRIAVAGPSARDLAPGFLRLDLGEERIGVEGEGAETLSLPRRKPDPVRLRLAIPEGPGTARVSGIRLLHR